MSADDDEPVVEVVPEVLAGERLDRVVALVCDVSRARSTELVAAGAVRLDGATVTVGSTKVRTGQELAVDLPSDAAQLPQPDPSVIVPVVHVDDDVIVVDKPDGLVVHPGSGNPSGTLVHGLLARYPEIAEVGDPMRPGIVHRLDKGTSGLLVVARSPRAYDSLVAQLVDHSAARTYLALVGGLPEQAAGVVDAPVGRSPRDPTRMAVTTTGKPARTRYEVERRFTHPEPSALVRCDLETGRTHQIRVHLGAIGHPVIGDATYRGVRRAIPAPRPMLHAWRLAFTHPGSDESVSFEAPLPADMQQVLDTLS